MSDVSGEVKLPAIFDRYRSDINAELHSIMATRQLPMYDMLRYHLGWIDEKSNALQGSAGKALRPSLCLLASEAAGGDYHQALSAAAALELIHNFSLIHDDIQDNDRERRHRPTVWAIWGMPQAINAGNAMHMIASLALYRLLERGITPERVLMAQQVLDQSCLEMIEGQYLDISFETRLNVTEDDYRCMIVKKTGSLIACSLEIGAMLASKDSRVAANFREFGRNLGMAFQIRDDYLGVWGNGQETGKPLGSDIRRGKKSFPVFYAFDRARGAQKERLDAVYRQKAIDEAGVKTVMDVLDSTGAQAATAEVALKYRDKALAVLRGTATSEWARNSLEEMVNFSVARAF